MASAMSQLGRGSINKVYRGRTLRVLVTPTPITFAERRAILQVLEQHGPVEVFKMTMGYHANFVAVMKNIQNAFTLAALSPLSYTVSTPRALPDLKFADLSAPEKLGQVKPTVQPYAKPADGEDGGASKEQKQFTLQLFRVSDFYHANTMAQVPLHKSWPESYTQHGAHMAGALKQSLPNNIAAEGLSHWDYDVDDWGEISPKRDRLLLNTWLPSRMRRTPKD